MATHSSTFAWKIPWTEEPGGLQSMGSLRSLNCSIQLEEPIKSITSRFLRVPLKLIASNVRALCNCCDHFRNTQPAVRLNGSPKSPWFYGGC